MQENEEIVWTEEYSTHDQLAMAIYSELHFQRYDEYFIYASELKRNQSLIRKVNGVEISFKIINQKIRIEYLLPDGTLMQDVADINWNPLTLENRVEEQMLLAIAEAETNALLFEPGKEFKFYDQPAIGFYQPVTSEKKFRNLIDSIRLRIRTRFRLFN